MKSCNDYGLYGSGALNEYMKQNKAVYILLVEDDLDHIELTTTALRDTGIVSEIKVAHDGEEAINYIFDNFSPKPDLVLLDINLPKLDGFEVLKKIKADPALHAIPVVLLTTSAEENDVVLGYRYGANSYVTKPVNYKDFVGKIKNIEFYWIFTNTLSTT